MKFGLPAMIGAVFGGFTLLIITKKSFVINYHFFSLNFNVELVNLIIGILILIFAIMEIIPRSKKISFNKNLLPIGGLLSGFFGGLSGNQGAFRSIFLLKCNLEPVQFIATGIIIACLVDVIRLTIYGSNFLNWGMLSDIPLILLTVLFAFLGSYIASKYMKKVTINSIKTLIAIMLLTISIGLITGLI